MLTALIVKTELPRNGLKKFINMLTGDRIITEISSAQGVVLRRIIYISRRNGKVNLNRLCAAIGEKCRVICLEDTVLPEGFVRFENNEFKSRLAINLGVYLLSKLKKRCPCLPVAYYDPEASWCEGVEEMSRYNDNIVVVSDNTEKYKQVCEDILDNSGAVVSVTDNIQRLKDRCLVIAPEAVREHLPLRGGAVVLSGSKPEVCLPCMYYYDYSFKMPDEFAGLKPSCFSAEYFSGALYSLARRYEFGSIVPMLCSNSAGSHTPASILEYIGKSC